MEQAQQALQKDDLERALELVEQAVAVDQQDPQKQLPALVQLAQMRGGKLAASDREAADDYFRKAASAARNYRELKKTPLNEIDKCRGCPWSFTEEACAFCQRQPVRQGDGIVARSDRCRVLQR